MKEEHTYQELQKRDREVYSSLQKPDQTKREKGKQPEFKVSVDSGAEAIKQENIYEGLQERDQEAYSSLEKQEKKKTTRVSDVGVTGSGQTAFSLRFRLLIVLLVVMLGITACVIYLVLHNNKSDGGGHQETPLNFQGNNTPTKNEDTTQAASHNMKGSLNENSFTTLGKNSYYFSTEKKNWQNSRDFCSNHQAILAVFKDEEELNKVTQHIKSLAVQGMYWIGLKKNESGWHWEDGTLLDSQRFPLDTSMSTTGCVLLLGDSLKPTPCTMPNKWICKKSTGGSDKGQE